MIMKDLKVGEVVTVNTPWKDNVIAVVLNVETVEVEHKNCRTENYVTLYGDNCLFKAQFLGYFYWKKDERGEPYSIWEYSELDQIELIMEGVHIDTLDKELQMVEIIPNGVLTKCSDLDDLFDWMTCWCRTPMNGSIMVNEEVVPVEEWKSDYLIDDYALDWVKSSRYPYCWFAIDRGCIESSCVFAAYAPKDDMGIDEVLLNNEKCLLVELPSSYSKDEIIRKLQGE